MVNADKKAIGRRIKEALDKAKITQRQLSRELGVKEPSVTGYVKGDSNVPADAYAKISELCGVSIDWLITGQSCLCDQSPEYEQSDKSVPDEMLDFLLRWEETPELRVLFDDLKGKSKDELLEYIRGGRRALRGEN